MATTNYITGLNGTDNTTYYLNEGVDTRFFRGTCSTAKGTAAKTVTLDDSTNFSLTAGVKVAVTFINGSSLTSRDSNIATLNVNSTGAKNIVFTNGNNVFDSTTIVADYDGSHVYIPIMDCQPYETLIFVYNGTYWVQNSVTPLIITGALATSTTNLDRLDIITGTENVVKVTHGGTGLTTSTYKNAVVIGNSTSATYAMQTIRTGDGAFYATAQDGVPTFGTLPVPQGGTGIKTATNVNAVVIGNSTNAANAMQTVATASGAFYATAANGKPQFGTLPVKQGGTGATTFTSNAVLYGNGTSAIQTKASANGALYATAANGTLSWGTLPVAQGGTGATSFTANSVIISGSSTTSALTTRAITNNTTNTSITNNNTNIPTMNTIYYGLATINGASQNRGVGVYAPTTAGTNGQILSSSGSGAPTWVDSSTVGSKIQIVRW